MVYVGSRLVADDIWPSESVDVTQMFITGPPTYSVGARLVTVAVVCRL